MQEALSGLEKIVVTGEDIKKALLSGGSLATPEDLRKRFESFMNDRCKGKDASKLRFVVERSISRLIMTRLTSLVMEVYMREWALQDAKSRLSEVVRLAMEHEPQEITLRGKPAVVVLSVEDYRRLVHPKPSFVELIRNSPLMEVDIDLTREQSLTREVDL